MSENPARPRIKLGQRVAASPAGDQGPRQLAFPADRTIRWVPRASASAPAPDVDLAVSQEVLLEINAHVGESFEKEIGGFLLGNRYKCPRRDREYVVIDQHSPAQFTEETAVSLSFTHEAWARLAEDLDGKFSGKLLVGWYHSHPRMDVFLSAHDVPIHEQRFSEVWKSALVITPDKHLGGFFCRRAGVLDPRTTVEFFELLDGAEVKTRQTVMSWEGYDAFDAEGQKLQPERSARTASQRLSLKSRPAPATQEKLQPFPAERVIHWLPKGEPAPPQNSFLVVTQSALEAVSQNLSMGGPTAGGFLLGNSYRCPNSGQRYLVIDQFSAAPLAPAGEASVFPAEAWQRLNEEMAGKFLGKELVGWYQPVSTEDVFRPEQPTSELTDEAIAVIMIDSARDRGFVLRRRSGMTPADFYELREVGAGDTPAVNWPKYRRADAPAGRIEIPSLPVASAPLSAAPAQALPVRPRSAPGARPGFGGKPILAGAGLAAVLLFGFLALKITGNRTQVVAQPHPEPAVDSRVVQNVPASVDLTPVDLKLVDPARPSKGLLLDMDLQSPPPGFELRIRDRRFTSRDYKEVAGAGTGAGSVRVHVTLLDPATLKIVENPAGAGVIPVEVIDPGTGKPVGARDIPLLAAAVRVTDEKKRKEINIQNAGHAKGSNAETAGLHESAVLAPQPDANAALQRELEEYKRSLAQIQAGNDEKDAALRKRQDKLEADIARKDAELAAARAAAAAAARTAAAAAAAAAAGSNPTATSGAVPPPQPNSSTLASPQQAVTMPPTINLSSLISRIDPIARKLTECLQPKKQGFHNVIHFDVCATTIKGEAGFFRELSGLPKPAGPFPALGRLADSLAGGSISNGDILSLSSELNGILSRLRERAATSRR